MGKFIRDLERSMTKPYEAMNDIVSSINKTARKEQEARNKHNQEIEAYIAYRIQGLRRKYNRYEQEIGNLPKLKCLNFDIPDKDYYYNSKFESFETTSDFIKDLRRRAIWHDITLSNRMALRTIAKDEKKLERFYEKHKAVSL